jgi:D-beta-D-heptose 7-phosphate kinase/D-beta-D-heptose 1-phosphate adenosyltransferase
VISDYAKGLLSEKLLARVISMAKQAGKALLVDPKGKDYSKYNGATVITPNRREAAEACNFHENGHRVVELAGSKLLGDLAVNAVLITQGEHGMTLFQRESKPVEFPTAARKVYDVTGAGDTVIATLAAATAAGGDLETATRLANIAAGLVVEQVGTSAVKIDELRQVVRSLAAS